MKAVYPVVSFPEYARFLKDFLFNGVSLPLIRVCPPQGKWPSEEIDIRPLLVARFADIDDNPANSIVQLQGEYLNLIFRDSAVWKRVLASGQIRAVTFRTERFKAYITFTISDELGLEWMQYGHGAVGHQCPEMDILSKDYPAIFSCFKCEAWGQDVVVRLPVPIWKKILMQGGYWDDKDHYESS